MRNPTKTIHWYTRSFALLLVLSSLFSCGEEVEQETLVSPHSYPLSPNSNTPGQILSAAVERLLASSGPLTIHHDRLGNISLITNNLALAKTRLSYSPIGALKSGDPSWTSHTFSGQEQDSSTGLLQFKHRHLDTDTGRWTSPDPLFAALKTSLVIKFGESTTSYAYVSHRLMNSFDPTGLSGRSGESKTQRQKRKSTAQKATEQKNTHKKLKRSERQGGHAMRRHQGDSQLTIARVTAPAGDPERANKVASTFTTPNDLDNAVSQVVNSHKEEVNAWLAADAGDNRLAITGDIMGVNATAHERVPRELDSGGEVRTKKGKVAAHRYPNPEYAATGGARQMESALLTRATVVLQKTSKSEYRIVTAYPHGN